MDKRQYIEKNLFDLAYVQSVSLLLIGAFIALALSGLDYIVAPSRFAQFFLYRLATAVFILANYFILSKFRSEKVLYGSIITTAFVLALMVELMILSFGGHQSPYYMGIAIILIFMLGFIPVNAGLAAVINIVVYATYLAPLLVFDTISNIPIFINSNVFLLAVVTGSIGWRYVNQKLLEKNLSLQYDLQEKSKHLEIYSLQLESMVDDRTKELSKSNKWHQALFENATDGIVVLDRNGIIMNANERACEMHGFSKEALVGSHSSLLEVDENRVVAAERFQQLLQGESLVYETAHYKKNGSRVFLEVSSKAIPIHDEVFIQSFQRDITEKKKIQEHLFQAQKMDSIGMLAGGIAHDFNNVLTAILGYTDLIRRDVGANEKVLGRLSVIENASRKAGRMVSQLLGFSRKSEIEMVPFDINAVVHDTVKLLERVIDKRVVIRLDLNERIPSVQGDVNKVEQVMMNFMVNARDAMPYGGIITVTSTAIDAIPGAAGVPPYIPAGRYVVLSVADTGVGIPEEIQRKIFEPFYTTKERGKGTGLGLAMVYGVVTEHRGYITVQSKVNQGTTFTVYFPVAAKATAETRKQAALSVHGNETIMLVEDDEHILEYIKVELENSGYKVIATTNPMSAIDAYSRMSREIALVITDVVMPLIDGRELMKRIAEINPRARFLAISEHEQRTKRGDDITPDTFLQKPFDAAEVLSAVRRILDDGKKLLPK
jgi:two-component system, cell cycle sensor histidine kinase and response regulator CckA